MVCTILVIGLANVNKTRTYVVLAENATDDDPDLTDGRARCLIELLSDTIEGRSFPLAAAATAQKHPREAQQRLDECPCIPAPEAARTAEFGAAEETASVRRRQHV